MNGFRGGLPGGQPPLPGGQPPDLQSQVKGMRSIMNPADVSMMKQDGDIDPNMTVIEFLKQMGIDPNGPASQFKDFAMKQMENANPLNKMKGLAGGPPGTSPGMGVPGGPQMGLPASPPPPDFDKLMR